MIERSRNSDGHAVPLAALPRRPCQRKGVRADYVEHPVQIRYLAGDHDVGGIALDAQTRLYPAKPCSHPAGVEPAKYLDGYLVGRDRLHRRRVLLLGLENGFQGGGRGEGRQAMRRLSPWRLRSGELFRPGVRGARDLHRELPAAALESVLYSGRHDLSGSAKRCDGPLQFR